MKKKLLTILFVLAPIFLATAITTNVHAGLGDDGWELKEGETLSYKDKNGKTVKVNGIKFTDRRWPQSNVYESTATSGKKVVFKVDKYTEEKTAGTVNPGKYTETSYCLAAYIDGKRQGGKNGCLPKTKGESAVSKKSTVASAMKKYLETTKIDGVTEICTTKSGKTTCKKATGKADPNDMDAVEAAMDADDEEGAENPNCYDGGGALGWVLCPIILKASEDIVDLYEKAVEPSLQVESSLIFGDAGQEGTREAWMIFRNIANLIFIMMFLFVIFSQLTGIGIDNYGVKKALPKLVVMAVLINLSFIVCALAVDASNLLGYGFKEMLFNISDRIVVSNPPDGASGGNGVLWGVAIAGALGAGLAIWANPAVVITAFIAMAAAFISILFLFVLLSVRKAAIVLLVAASPVAIALYSLPNTKGIFDKWFSFFKAMLMVFPVVGLLMGGGQLASAIILAANPGDQFFLWFVGMIVSLAPIFFVPSIIRSSMAALGTAGARLAGLGNVLSGRARAGMANSRLNQAAQLAGTRRQARIRAGMNKDGSVNKNSLRGKFARTRLGRMTGANATMEGARADYRKMVKDEGARRMLMDDEMYGSDIGNIQYEAEKAMYDQRVGDMINGGEVQEFLDDAIASGNGIAIASAAEKLEAIGELDKLTQSIMGYTDANGVSHSGVTVDALKNDTFKARLGNTMIGLKKSSPHLGAYGAYLKNGGAGTIVDAAAGRNLNGAKSIGGYMQGFGDSILSDADKTSLEAMGTLAQAAGVSTSSFVNDSQVATGISGLSSDKARDKFVGAGFISSQNQASVAGRLTTGRGINDAIASQIGYDNLRANTTLVSEARSQNVSGLDATYRTNILNGTGPRPTQGPPLRGGGQTFNSGQPPRLR